MENEIDGLKKRGDALNSQSYKANANNSPLAKTSNGYRERQSSFDSVAPKKFSWGATVYFFFGAMLVAIFSLAYLGYTLFASKNSVSSELIVVNVDVASQAASGDVSNVVVMIKNNNRIAVTNVKASLSNVKTGVAEEESVGGIPETYDIGVINPGETKTISSTKSVFGKEGDVSLTNVEINYNVPGSTNTFTKNATARTVVGLSPFGVRIEGPSSLSGQAASQFDFIVTNLSATNTLPFRVVANVSSLLVVEDLYPSTGKDGKAIWSVPPLAKGESFYGKLALKQGGKNGEAFVVIKVMPNEDDSVVAIAKKSVLTFGPAFELNVMRDAGGAEGVISFGERASFVVSYMNKSSSTVRDVNIVATLAGDAIVWEGVSVSNGYYDSQKKTLTWNSGGVKDLQSLAPNARGSLRFTIPIIASGAGSPSFSVSVKSVGSTAKTDDVVVFASSTWSVKGVANLQASSFYDGGAFKNTGYNPPKANSQSTFGINLGVYASSPIEGARIVATLPQYVEWTGSVASGTNIVYDSKNRTVVFNVGSVIGGGLATGSFQVSIKPSLSQVGQVLPLTSSVMLEAVDVGLKQKIRQTVSAPNTKINGSSDGRVIN